MWCAGCAHGEEPYSLGFLLSSAGMSAGILATDILSDALEKAALAVYNESKLRELPSEFRRQFRESAGGWRVPERIRNLVTFLHDDLRSSRVEGPFDIIFCRNVLIYFTPQLQSQIISHLSSALKPGGLLVLGYAESSLLKLSGLTRLNDHGLFSKDRKPEVVVKIAGPPLESGVSLLADALASYARGRHEHAGKLFDASFEEGPFSPIGRYFKAMLEIESGQLQNAKEHLRLIVEQPATLDPETEQFLQKHGMDLNRFHLTVSRVLERLEARC